MADFTEGRARMRKKFRPNEKPYLEYQSKADKIMENISPIITESHSIIESLKNIKQSASSIEILGTQKKDSAKTEVNIESSNEVKKADTDVAILKSSNDQLPEIPGETEEEEWEEVKLEENQNMKIQRLLQQGDTIVEIVNCARLVGLELIGTFKIVDYL